MARVRAEVETVLRRNPDLEDALACLVELDREGPWTREDIEVDPGDLGEMVSRGIVNRVDGEYTLSNREAVEEALRNGPNPDPSGVLLQNFSFEGALLLFSALILTLVFRAYNLPAVFRKGDTVLLGNDPYYYRYWVERLVLRSSDLTDVSAITNLPAEIGNGEPLLVALLWFFSETLGGGAEAAGSLMALYPVVSAVIAAVVIYLFMFKLTHDVGEAILAVVLLALIPGHIFRTSLGYADHHALDYLFLILTATTLFYLDRSYPRPRRRPRTSLLVTVILAFAISMQVIAWDNGPLLILPLLIYVLLRTVHEVDNARSPTASMRGVLGAVALATLLTQVPHVLLGWHTDLVVYSPLIILILASIVLFLGEVMLRLGRGSKMSLLVTELLALGVLFVAFRMAFPAYVSRFYDRLAILFVPGGAFETMPLYAGDLGVVKGPFYFFGLLLFIALPFMAWTVYEMYRGRRRELLVPSVYAWYFLGLAMIQRRFTGELAPFVAIFAALTLVWAADRFDLLDTMRGEDIEIRKAAPALGVILLIAVTSFVPATQMVGSLVIDGDAHDAARWMDEYAVDQGWNYPDNYVFSHWGRNRMYNYFVNGESRYYGFAKRNYGDFLRSRDPAAWYDRIEGRTGFVVTSNRNLNIGKGVPNDLVLFRLHDRFGSAGDGSPGVAHFRAVYSSPDGSVKVFTLVPGATITGTGPANVTTLISTDVEIEGASFTYQRVVRTDGDGRFSVTVPYPGRYDLGGGSLAVTRWDVENGRTISLE